MSPKTQNRRSEDPGLTAWLTLLQANSVLVDLLEADLMASQGMPLGWFEVLVQLTTAPDDRLKMQELAHSVLLSKSGVTRLVDRMESAGLVTRDSCASDRRVVYAVATEAGRTALRNAMPPHMESLADRFTKHLTPAELGMLRATLQKVLDAHGFSPPPCPTSEQLGLANEPRETPVG